MSFGGWLQGDPREMAKPAIPLGLKTMLPADWLAHPCGSPPTCGDPGG